MIYLFLADGFEETEAIAPLDMLRRAKFDVKTVGVTGKTVTSSHKVPVTCDITIDEINLESTDMLVLPGGMPGTLNLEKSEGVQKALDYAHDNNKFIGAICAAPSILGHKGFLNGKKAACFTGFEKDLKGATICSDEGVVQDGKIITARGAGVAEQFGFKLVEALGGKALSDKIREAVLF